MAQLLQTSITGSIASTGSLIISGSDPVQLPLLSSGSGEIDLTTPYQLWFDSGDNYVKYHVKGSYQAGAWSAATPLTTGRDALVGAGEQIAGIVYGGSDPAVSNKTEEYNGLTWSNGGNLITARLNISKGFGTQNAAIAIGAVPATSNTEEYNGTSWSSGNAQTTGGYGARGGTQNSYSKIRSSGDTDSHENYDGTSWSNQTCAPVSGRSSAGAGISADAMLNFGGFPGQNNTIAWNCDLGECVFSNLHCKTRCLDATCTQI